MLNGQSWKVGWMLRWTNWAVGNVKFEVDILYCIYPRMNQISDARKYM